MQRRLTDLRNGLVASDFSTLKVSTSFSGPRRCVIFDIARVQVNFELPEEGKRCSKNTSTPQFTCTNKPNKKIIFNTFLREFKKRQHFVLELTEWARAGEGFPPPGIYSSVSSSEILPTTSSYWIPSSELLLRSLLAPALFLLSLSCCLVVSISRNSAQVRFNQSGDGPPQTVHTRLHPQRIWRI